MDQKFLLVIVVLSVVSQIGAGVGGYYYGKSGGRGSLSCNEGGQLVGTNLDFVNTSVQFFGSGDNASELDHQLTTNFMM